MATVLVYADDPAVREHVRLALGQRPADDLPPLTFVETEDGPRTIATVDAGGIDLCVFDGEAWPTGGLGLCRQLKNEVPDPPAIVVLIARRDDRWLAAWSQCDAWVCHPVDPVELTEVVVRLLRERASRAPVPVSPRRGLGRFHRS